MEGNTAGTVNFSTFAISLAGLIPQICSKVNQCLFKSLEPFFAEIDWCNTCVHIIMETIL